MFNTEEKLDNHKKLHFNMDLMFSCSHCPKKFSHLKSKYRHINSEHLNPTIKSNIGFFKFDGPGPVTRKFGRNIYRCHVDGCTWQGKDKSRLQSHLKNKHCDKPRPTKKVFRCSGPGCTKIFTRKSRYDKHLSKCKYYICSRPRMVNILTTGKIILLQHFN